MLRGRATHPSATEASSRWVGTLRDPSLIAAALYGLVAMAAAVAAYLALFTQFAPYDDEGTLLVTLNAFANGDTLYRDIYSPYGPFYYEVFGGFFALTGEAVTTNASRSIVIVLWVATSLLFGIASQRLTGRLAIGIGGMIVAFGALFVLIGEPMHPQGLSVLLIGLFIVLVAREPSLRSLPAGTVCGALLAALILTKVNLGAFAVAAVALAAVLTVEPLQRRRWVRLPATAAFLALPLLITYRDLNVDWVRELMAVEVLAMAAVVVAARTLRPGGGDGAGGVDRWLLGAVVGFATAFAAILVAIMLTGPSPSEVYDGVVTEAIRVRDVLVTQFPFPPAAVNWGIAAVAAAALTSRLRSPGGEKPTIWPALLRAGAGLAIWFAVARIMLVSLNPSAGNPDLLPMLLAWVAVVPPAGAPESVRRRFLRVLLPALAVAQTLQVYPVAGSQMGIAALTFVPVGALCLGDSLASLRAWSAARGSATLQRFGTVAGIVSVVVVAQLALNSIVRPAVDGAVAYRDQRALPFAGANRLRLPAPEVETYVRLVELLHDHGCTGFIGYPNINSLYLWSGIAAPSPQAPGAWLNALDSERQQRVVDELRASPRPCAIRSDARAEGWLHGRPPPDRPLVRYVLDRFRPVEQVGEFQFMLPIETGSRQERSG